jgi:hypothetical protein
VIHRIYCFIEVGMKKYFKLDKKENPSSVKVMLKILKLKS